MQFQKLGPGKFSDSVQEYLHELTMNGADSEKETDGSNHYLLHLTPEEQQHLQQAGHGYETAKSVIVSEDHSGFVTVEVFPTDAAGQQAFESLGGKQGPSDPDVPHPPIGEEDKPKQPEEEDPTEGEPPDEEPPEDEEPVDTDGFPGQGDLPPPPEEDDYELHPDLPPPEEPEAAAPPVDDRSERLMDVLKALHDKITQAMQMRRSGQMAKAVQLEEIAGRMIDDARSEGYGPQAEDVELLTHSGDTWDEIEADLRDSLGIRAPVAPDAPPAEEPTLPDDTQEEAISNYRVRQLRKSAQKFASDENKPYHVVYRKDDRGESYEVMDDDQYSMYHKTHTKKYTYRPMKKTEARLKAPPPAASAPEAPPEYTVMRKPYAHQSQCSRCGYEGRVYEYGHDYPGKGIQWMPGKFCGKSCYYGYHDSKSQMPPAASAMGEDMKTESGPPEPGSAAYRARVALRLAAGGGNPKKIMEDLFGDGPDIGAQNQSSMYMVIQPNDKVTVTGPDGQPMAAVAIRKTDDGSGWVLDVQGAQGLASKETVVSVASPVADMDQGFGPEPGGMEDEFGDEGEPEPEPDGDEGFPPDEDDGSVSAGPAEVDIEEPEDEES